MKCVEFKFLRIFFIIDDVFSLRHWTYIFWRRFSKIQHLTFKRPRILYLSALLFPFFEIRHPKDQGVTSYFRGLDCWRSRTRPLRNFRILLLDSMTKITPWSYTWNFWTSKSHWRSLQCSEETDEEKDVKRSARIPKKKVKKIMDSEKGIKMISN